MNLLDALSPGTSEQVQQNLETVKLAVIVQVAASVVAAVCLVILVVKLWKR